MAKKWKQEDFIREFYKRNPSAKDIEILSPYISNKKKMICRCKIDVLADLEVLNSRNIEFERVE